jgi:hypothetical protein
VLSELVGLGAPDVVGVMGVGEVEVGGAAGADEGVEVGLRGDVSPELCGDLGVARLLIGVGEVLSGAPQLGAGSA